MFEVVLALSLVLVVQKMIQGQELLILTTNSGVDGLLLHLRHFKFGWREVSSGIKLRPELCLRLISVPDLHLKALCEELLAFFLLHKGVILVISLPVIWVVVSIRPGKHRSRSFFLLPWTDIVEPFRVIGLVHVSLYKVVFRKLARRPLRLHLRFKAERHCVCLADLFKHHELSVLVLLLLYCF